VKVIYRVTASNPLWPQAMRRRPAIAWREALAEGRTGAVLISEITPRERRPCTTVGKAIGSECDRASNSFRSPEPETCSMCVSTMYGKRETSAVIGSGKMGDAL
jgi:hypothetical protein